MTHIANPAAQDLDGSDLSSMDAPAPPTTMPTSGVAGQLSSGSAPVMLPLNRLHPHPLNPRLAPREDVITAICRALRNGFDPAHALIVRPFEADWEITSGHHRAEAARRAGLTEVPCWVRQYDDDEAYMLLVTSNSQGELSPLERGLHALSSGMEIKSYAARAGRKQQTVSDEVCAARVAQTVPDIRYELSRYFSQLVAIHTSPAWLWPALATATLRKDWTVAQARAAVRRLKGCPPDQPEWASAGFSEALISGTVLPDDLQRIEELRVRTAAELYNLERQRCAVACIDPPREDFGATALASKMIADDAAFSNYSEALDYFNTLSATAARDLAELRDADAKKHKKLDEVRQKVIELGDSVSLEVWHSLDDVTRAALLRPDPALVSAIQFEKQGNAEFEWAKWSWNPITGCEHSCPYRSAREIATSKRRAKDYPSGFAPTLRPSALLAPRMMPLPLNGVCDPRDLNVITGWMAHLFDARLPGEWIDAVLSEIRNAPNWNFPCLTKSPERMAQFTIPANMWMGASVDSQARVAAAEAAFINVGSQVKWLCCQLLIEPLHFQHLDRFHWLVIGGASANKQGGTPEWHPPFEWIADLVRQARDAGLKVYFTPNLLGKRIEEFPFDTPIKSDPIEAPPEFHYLTAGG